MLVIVGSVLPNPEIAPEPAPNKINANVPMNSTRSFFDKLYIFSPLLLDSTNIACRTHIVKYV
jgi:hypothetical protein